MELGRAPARIGLVLAVLAMSGCGEEIVVRETTRVYRDGSVFRTIAVAGREADGQLPQEPRWLKDNARLELASPEAWDSVDERPGYLAAEQTFGSAGQVPPLLAHSEGGENEQREVLDRSRIELVSDDLVVLHRFTYRETRGDPYGIEELDAALDAMVDFAVRFLRDEVRREFGPELDASRAEAFLRTDVRSLTGDVLRILRQSSGLGSDAQATRPIAELLVRRGIFRPGEIPVDEIEGDDILDFTAPRVTEWILGGLARTLSTPGRPIEPADLDFWPGLEDATAIENTDEPVDPRMQEFNEIGSSLLRALSGYYGNDGSPHFRFESRVEMPGRLLRTNGTPVDGAVVWLYRNSDLTLGDVVLEAETVELDDDALKTLGARRDLDTPRMLQLTDLLSRDAGGELLKLLAAAAERGSLDLLLDEEQLNEDTLIPARELHGLLDPNDDPWPQM